MGKPVASQIIVEVPRGLGQVRIEEVESQIRRTLGSEMSFGNTMFFQEAEGGSSYVGADGGRFQASPGYEFKRLDAALEHPASGFGRGGLDKAAKLIEFAQDELGARRVLYGAAGIATHSDRGRMATKVWSEQSYAELKVLANLAARSGNALAATPVIARPKVF